MKSLSLELLSGPKSRIQLNNLQKQMWLEKTQNKLIFKGTFQYSIYIFFQVLQSKLLQYFAGTGSWKADVESFCSVEDLQFSVEDYMEKIFDGNIIVALFLFFFIVSFT